MLQLRYITLHIDLKCQNYYIKSAIINSFADFRSYPLNKLKKYITQALGQIMVVSLKRVPKKVGFKIYSKKHSHALPTEVVAMCQYNIS